MSPEDTAEFPGYERAIEPRSSCASPNKDSEHPYFGHPDDAEKELAEHRKSSEGTKRFEIAMVHFVWPVDTVSTASKEQTKRIIEAIRGITDRPEEIHSCLLGDLLVYAKAYMTAIQASTLETHPDVRYIYSFCWFHY